MATTEVSPPGRIVVGVDGSDSSVAALTWAANQARITGADLAVIMSWEWPTSYGWAPPYPDEYDPAGLAQKVLDTVVAKAGLDDLNTESRLVAGHPALVLVEASAGADLLVVGSRGHGEFTGMLIGSVSQHCTAHAHCPVLVYRDST